MWQPPLQGPVAGSFLRCLHIYKWLYRQRRGSRTTADSDPPIYHLLSSLCLVSIWSDQNQLSCLVTDYCRSESYCYLLSYRFSHCFDCWVTYHYSFRLPLFLFLLLRPLSFLAQRPRPRTLQWAVVNVHLRSEQMPVFLMQLQGSYRGYCRYIFHDHMNWHMSCSKSYFQNFPNYLDQQGSWPGYTHKCTSDSQYFVRTPTYLSYWV